MPGVIGGVYFLAFLVIVLLIIRWFMVNEGRPSEQPLNGLFAMRDMSKKKSRGSQRRQGIVHPPQS